MRGDGTGEGGGEGGREGGEGGGGLLGNETWQWIPSNECRDSRDRAAIATEGRSCSGAVVLLKLELKILWIRSAFSRSQERLFKTVASTNTYKRYSPFDTDIPELNYSSLIQLEY